MSNPPPRTVKLFDQDIEVVTPPAIQPVWADVITELSIINGVVHIGVGAVTMDGSGPAIVQTQTKLRVPLTLISDLDKGINRLLDQAEQAKKSAN